ARLAAARAGEDQHRPVGSFDSLALLRVELIEKRQCGSGSGSDDLILQGNCESRGGGFFVRRTRLSFRTASAVRNLLFSRAESLRRRTAGSSALSPRCARLRALGMTMCEADH